MYSEAERAIHNKAELIMKSLIGAMIYGDALDLTNPEQMLFAAYELGVSDTKQECAADYAVMWGLGKGNKR